MNSAQPTPDTGAPGAGVFAEVVRRGIAAVRADLKRLEAEVDAPPAATPLPARPPRKARKLRAQRPTPGRLALPAPKATPTSTRRKDAYVKPAPLRDAIVRVLTRASSPLTPCEIAERLRSRPFGYDPHGATDKELRARIHTCMGQYRDHFTSAGHRVGWVLKG